MNKELLIKMLRDCLNEKKEKIYTYNKEILELAFHHGIETLIGDLMKLGRNELVNLISVKQNNVQKHKANFENFKQVALELERSNINYSITKGAYVGRIAYPNESYRRSDDLDIIIKREDYIKVKRLLNNNGYVQGIYNYKDRKIHTFSRKQELFYLTYTQQSPPFIKIIKNKAIPFINLDLNFNIFWGKSKWNVEDLINHSQDIEYWGCVAKTLQDEYILLHLCLHAYFDMNSIYVLYKDYSFRLRYFVDIYGFIKNAKISWEKFNFICIKYGVDKYITYIFYYTSVVFKDDSLLFITGLKMPDKKFLNSFGLSHEGRYQWKENFYERLFCRDKQNMLNKYIDKNIKDKIIKGRNLEGYL